MAQQFVTDAGVLIVPGAYSKVVVQNNPSGLATTGVIMAVGEADAGARFSDEARLDQNAYGPDQIADVVAKYKSGPLVDAFRACVAAANDPNIVGSFSRFIAVKTNASTRAAALFSKIGGGTHTAIQDKNLGKAGNLISYSVAAAAAEAVPTSGPVVLAPPQVTTTVECRVDGGAAVTATLNAADLPSVMAASIDALTGVAATGGVNRAILTAAVGTVTVAIVSGFAATFTRSVAWDVLPTPGDTLYLPTGSPFATANEGTWVVTAATATVVTAYKLLDAAGAGAALTAPTAEGPITLGATTNIAAFSPVVIANEAAAVSPGKGKTLEIANTATGSFAALAFVFAAGAAPPAAAATFVSASGAPKVLTAAAEYAVTVTVARQLDAVAEAVTTGGAVLLTLGYTGTTASAVIAAGVLTITVVGGAGTSKTLTLADFPTIGDLVSYLSAQPGYTAAAGSAALAQRSTATLDPGTYAVATKWGAKTGRIKADAAGFLAAVSAGSVLVNAVAAPGVTPAGLPDVSSLAFLSGGARGATADADVAAALTALQAVRGNFVVPLFSNDAVLDVADGLTDAASAYTIAAVHANALSHVLTMAQLKQRRPRQAMLAYRGTFAAALQAAGTLASSRCSLCFQDARTTDSTGAVKQFRPWLLAAKAAGMQAAGFYKAIVNKFVNVSGVLQAAGDYNDQLLSQEETALTGGLLPVVRDEAGGFRWVSDQTTYTRDDNFVFNSIQAVYAADVIAQTTAQRMERAFVGQSVADISAALALTTLEGIMADMKRLKLIAASDDAPRGFKSATVRIVGPSMAVSLEVKLAGALYFVALSFLVTPVQQSAG